MTLKLISKDYRDMVGAACTAGWTIHQRKSGIVLRSPDGVTTVMVHGTYSDKRAWRNTRAELRRAGVKVA